MQTEAPTKVNGSMTWPKGKVLIGMSMALSTLESGSRTKSMAWEKSSGPMVINIRVTIKTDASTAQEPLCGMMGPPIQVNS